MMFFIVVACTQKGGIAHEGRIPWNIPSDMAHFYQTTCADMTSAIIMGRKTWESLPKKPLKHRYNIVVSSQTLNDAPLVSPSLDDALDLASTIATHAFVIGGEKVYAEAVDHPNCEGVIATIVSDPPDIQCDQYFRLDESLRRFPCRRVIREETVENGYTYCIVELTV